MATTETIISQELKSEIESDLGFEILKILGISKELYVTELELKCSINRSSITLKCDLLSKDQELKIRNLLKEKLGG